MKIRESGDFLAAWGGISSLQLRLSVMWTEAQRRGFSLLDLSKWLSSAPAQLVGLDQSKGAIVAGRDADIVIWKPEQEFRVEARMLRHRHQVTPYQGEILRGVVQQTFLRGRLIYGGDETDSYPQGVFLLHTGSAATIS